MSRFYASISGGRGEATRQGHAGSGITGHVRGWRSGVRVYGHAAGEDDVFDIWATAGSGGHRSDMFVGTVTLDNDGSPTFTAAR